MQAVEQKMAKELYKNKEIRESLTDSFEIVYCTDGSIVFNNNSVKDFIAFITTSNDAINWGKTDTLEAKLLKANKIIMHFFDLIVESKKYYIAFSRN